MAEEDDGLPVSDVGEWALDKHERLRRYVDIARGVRKQFISRAGATYIELFSGPGRSRIRETGQVIDGSPIVATKKAIEGGAPYTGVFIADADASYVNAAHIRLARQGVPFSQFVGPAERTVRQIVPKLDKRALHFAFLDPYNLDDLPFSIIEDLAKLQRMDMLVHVSAQDLQRNLRRYIDEKGGPLDRVAPGWRDVISSRDRDESIRVGFLNYWLGLIRKLDMAPSQGIELVSGSKNQPLYWLVFISRHERAGEFWNKIRNITPQRRLDL